MKPVKVIVHASRTPFFPEPDYAYDYEEFKRIAHSCAIQNRTNSGRTEITVEFENGITMGMELCLNVEGVPSIAAELSNIKKSLTAQPMKEDTVEAQVEKDFIDFLAGIEL